MANLQYGDMINNLPNTNIFVTGINDVVPVRFDGISGKWVVCEQSRASHMFITMSATDMEDRDIITTMMIEIGKCENLYLLADALVD